jgi:serine/threonine-protein kinase
MVGTPAYFSPERIKGVPDEVKSDVYSVGVMFFEMLAGCSPYRMDQIGVVHLMMAHLYETPRSLRAINPEVPEALEAVVMRALAKEPEDRPSAEELADLVAAAAVDLPSVDAHSDTGEFSAVETADTVVESALPRAGVESYPVHGASADPVPTDFHVQETALIKPDSGQVGGETAAVEIALQETTVVPSPRRKTSETNRRDVEHAATDLADAETGVIARDEAFRRG